MSSLADDRSGQPSAAIGYVKVTMIGSSGVKVRITGDGTVDDVVRAAAELIGANIVPGQVAFVKNGEQVHPDAPVDEGDRITVAGRIGNG